MRKFFFLWVFAFSISRLSADFCDGITSKFLEIGLASTTNRGIERNSILCSVQGGLESQWIEGIAGFQSYEDCSDFTFKANGWFPFADWQSEDSRLRLGLGGIYHFQRYNEISLEHDYILNFLLRHQNLSGKTISFFCGYAGKAAKIYALEDYVPWIYDTYPEAGILIDKVWKNGIEAYFELALNDMYRYPHFCTPHYLFGTAFNLDSGLRFSSDISIRIADGYAASPYIDSMILRFGVRYTF
ncbi:hypothetical protein [uncultured Treponema sp.]|uniref:hypothetical protein n=1 Tax=uncultured Treponema sp. TaxID=162155 RepID=UPI0025E8E5EC|nr:hypothetical protein [uncultured Treponema sp.]